MTGTSTGFDPQQGMEVSDWELSRAKSLENPPGAAAGNEHPEYSSPPGPVSGPM